MSGGRLICLRAPSFWRECDKSRGVGGSVPNLMIGREATSWDRPAVLLKLSRRHIAESRVKPVLVVDAFEKFTDLRIGIGQVSILVTVDLFVLQRFHERFASRIIIRIPFAAHADLGTILLQQIGVIVRSVLHTAIGMMHQPWRRPSLM